MSNKSRKLPKIIIPIKNPDKEFHEKWHMGRDLLNFPHPFRACFCGPPNKGKTTAVLNVLLRADPPFKNMTVVHCDGDFTQEYDLSGCDMIDTIPSPEEFEGVEKTLMVLDDLEFKRMHKDQKRALDRLFGYVSTHKNVSVICCSQDPFEIPTIVRRCSNLWVIWKMDDVDTLVRVARRTGLNRDDFMYIFNNFIKEEHDSLWIDKTARTKAPLRINGYKIIKKPKKKPKKKMVKNRRFGMNNF
jgi:hypothetical protein